MRLLLFVLIAVQGCFGQASEHVFTVVPDATRANVGRVDFRDKQTTFHMVSLDAPDTVAANIVFRLPSTIAAGCMVSDASGNLSIDPTCTGAAIWIDNGMGAVSLVNPANTVIISSLQFSDTSGSLLNSGTLDLKSGGNFRVALDKGGALGSGSIKLFNTAGTFSSGFQAGALSASTLWTLPLSDAVGPIVSNGSATLSIATDMMTTDTTQTVTGVKTYSASLVIGAGVFLQFSSPVDWSIVNNVTHVLSFKDASSVTQMSLSDISTDVILSTPHIIAASSVDTAVALTASGHSGTQSANIVEFYNDGGGTLLFSLSPAGLITLDSGSTISPSGGGMALSGTIGTTNIVNSAQVASGYFGACNGDTRGYRVTDATSHTAVQVIDCSENLINIGNITMNGTITGCTNCTNYWTASGSDIVNNNSGKVIVSRNATALTVSPFTDVVFQVANTDGVNSRILVDAFAAGATLAFRRADNTNASPSAVVSGDGIGSVSFHGYNGSAYTLSRAVIAGFAGENWSTGANGTYLSFYTTALGATSMAERLRIDPSGNVILQNNEMIQFGTSTPLFVGGGGAGFLKITDSGGSNLVWQANTTTSDEFIYQTHTQVQPQTDAAKALEIFGHSATQSGNLIEADVTGTVIFSLTPGGAITIGGAASIYGSGGGVTLLGTTATTNIVNSGQVNSGYMSACNGDTRGYRITTTQFIDCSLNLINIAGMTFASDGVAAIGTSTVRAGNIESTLFVSRSSSGSSRFCEVSGGSMLCSNASTTNFSVSSLTGQILSVALSGSGTRCLNSDNSGNITLFSAACAVGTVTSIATSGPISGGTITGSGTISCPICLTTSGSQSISGGETFNGGITLSHSSNSDLYTGSSGNFYTRSIAGSSISCSGVADGWLSMDTSGNNLLACMGGARYKVAMAAY